MDKTAQPPVVQLFANPGAGKGRSRRVEALAGAFEAEGARVLQSISAHEPPTIAPDATHVCVAGGDGTVRHVAGAVLRSGRALRMSVYPAGTINLLAREAGHTRDPRQFARLALGAEADRPHYPVALDDGHFLACAGVGPDSLAVAGVSRGLKRTLGRFAYAVALVRLLIHWPRHRITLRADGRQIDCEAFYVAKGRHYAGPWSVAPEARVGRPAMHVVALRRARRRDYLSFMAAIAAHRDPAGLANVDAFECVNLTAEAEEPLPVQADGDIVGALPVTMILSKTPLSFS
jgi:diacylglycerol kinase family enzyme